MTLQMLLDLVEILLMPAIGFILAVQWYLNSRINRLHERVNQWQLKTVEEHPTKSDFSTLKSDLKTELQQIRGEISTFHKDILEWLRGKVP